MSRVITVKCDELNILPRVQEFAHEFHLWEAGAYLLLAVSGGPDSVVLLDILASLASQEELQLAICHVNHKLRLEAGEDATFVQCLAEQYHVPYYYAEVDVPARVAETGESVEEAARQLRYAALARYASECGAKSIVTGHTADDQAETVLMRVLRGTGVTGLSGIPPRRDNIIRPMLNIWRSEIEAYIRERSLAYRTDASNLTTEYTRNRIRLALLPLLEHEYAPGLHTRLHHLAELARHENNALDTLAHEAYNKTVEQLPDGISLIPDAQMPKALQWRVWRYAIAEVSGSLENIAFEHIEAIQRLAPGMQVHLPGVHVWLEAGRLVFLPAKEAGMTEQNIPQQNLSVPGVLSLPNTATCLRCERIEGKMTPQGGDVAIIDANTVYGELIVRSWLPGDRYRPFGAPGTRKLQDIFVDARVPRRLRNRIPLILDDKGIIWLAGFRPADRVKITDRTTQNLRIQIEWEFNPWTSKRSSNK